MTSFNKKLARAKRAGRPHKDITIALRSDVQERRNALQDRIEALTVRATAERHAAESDQRLTAGPAPSTVADDLAALVDEAQQLDVEEADSLVTLRLWQIPGSEWAAAMTEHADSDGQDVAMTVAQRVGRVVEDGKTIQPSEDQWAELWDQMDGSAFMAVVNTVYELNATDGMERVARLGKVSALTPAPSEGSPA